MCETSDSFRDIEVLHRHSILDAVAALGTIEISSLAWVELWSVSSAAPCSTKLSLERASNKNLLLQLLAMALL